MDIFVSLKNLIKKINVIDKRARRLSQTQNYSSNPFAFVQNKTYVWIDNNTQDSCNIQNKDNLH